MDTLQVLPEQRARMRRLLASAKAANERGDIAQVDKLTSELDSLVADAYLDNRKSAFHGFGPAARGEGAFAFDPLSWREIKAAGATVRYHVPLAAETKGYGSAFAAYLAKGTPDALGPNDRKALTAGVDSSGGFLISDDFHAGVVKKMAAVSPIFARGTHVPVSSDSLTMPRIKYDTDDKFTSGARFTWTGEIPESSSVHRLSDGDIIAGKIRVPINTALASCVVSQDLLEDAPINALVTNLLGEAIGAGFEVAFTLGNGSNQPLGLLTQVDGDGPASVLSGTDGALTTTDDDYTGKRINDLIFDVPSQYWPDSSWLMNASTLQAINDLVDASKRPLVSWGGDGIATLRGRPIGASPFMPDVATDAYPIVFGDLSSYLIGERIGLSVRLIREASGLLEQNATCILARARVGGYLAEPWKIKVLKAAAS